MKGKNFLMITALLQTGWLVLILIDFLCMWLFSCSGFILFYLVTLLSYLPVVFIPVDIICFIPNLIVWIHGLKTSNKHYNRTLYGIVIFLFPVLLFLLRWCLIQYGSETMTSIV